MPEPNQSPADSNLQTEPAGSGEERRKNSGDRRKSSKDRRNPERLADEIAPRRHPDIKGRRATDPAS